MIDNISEPGAWEREMAQQPRCIWCRHYRYKEVQSALRAYCGLERPLVPCSMYEREPGADDE
jgi:hypothetical protein